MNSVLEKVKTVFHARAEKKINSNWVISKKDMVVTVVENSDILQKECFKVSKTGAAGDEADYKDYFYLDENNNFYHLDVKMGCVHTSNYAGDSNIDREGEKIKHAISRLKILPKFIIEENWGFFKWDGQESYDYHNIYIYRV